MNTMVYIYCMQLSLIESVTVTRSLITEGIESIMMTQCSTDHALMTCSNNDGCNFNRSTARGPLTCINRVIRFSNKWMLVCRIIIN